MPFSHLLLLVAAFKRGRVFYYKQVYWIKPKPTWMLFQEGRELIFNVQLIERRLIVDKSSEVTAP